MKSTITRAKPPLTAFPRLMSGPNGIVVLFTDPFEGVVVASDFGGNSVGRYSNSWDAHAFNLFHGTVTLENDK